MIRRPPRSTLFPSTTLSRSGGARREGRKPRSRESALREPLRRPVRGAGPEAELGRPPVGPRVEAARRLEEALGDGLGRSEEHTSELQSRLHLVCRLLLEKKK